MEHNEKLIEDFKKQFPSIKHVHRVCVDTTVFKTDDNVISIADVKNYCTDNNKIKEAIEKARNVDDSNIGTYYSLDDVLNDLLEELNLGDK
jgi:hypothetical protein